MDRHRSFTPSVTLQLRETARSLACDRDLFFDVKEVSMSTYIRVCIMSADRQSGVERSFQEGVGAEAGARISACVGDDSAFPLAGVKVFSTVYREFIVTYSKTLSTAV